MSAVVERTVACPKPEICGQSNKALFDRNL